MIDKTDEFWASATADDIDEYLKAYSDNSALEVEPIICGCGGDSFTMRTVLDKNFIEIKCESCGEKKYISESSEYHGRTEPENFECPICSSRAHNVRMGVRRRKNGSVKWIYIGVRCLQCKALGSPLDWKVDPEPVDEMKSGL